MYELKRKGMMVLEKGVQSFKKQKLPKKRRVRNELWAFCVLLLFIFTQNNQITSDARMDRCQNKDSRYLIIPCLAVEVSMSLR